MGRARNPRGWGRPPAKGSLMRRMLKMLLRPEGATTSELVEVGLRKELVRAYIGVLRNQKGWDVRAFPTSRGKVLRYKVIGKLRWNGTVRPIPRDLDRRMLKEVERL